MQAIRWFRRGLVVAVVLLVALLAGIVWLWRRYPSVDGFWWILLTVGVVSLWSIAVSLFLLMVAFRARTKYRGQLAWFIARNPSAFVEAADPTAGQTLPSLASAPLPILWRYRPGARWITGVAVGFILVDFVPPLGIASGVPPFSTLTQSFSALNPLFNLGIALGVAFLIAVAVQAVLVRPFGVILSETGIEMRREFGRRRVLRWNEARYLDYHISKGRYELRGDHRSVSWSRFVPKNARPLGVSPDEAASYLRSTLAIVQERTGLRPRAVV